MSADTPARPKGCPFCGGHASFDRMSGYTLLFCDDCGAHGPAINSPQADWDAVEAWNRRKGEDELRQTITSLQKPPLRCQGCGGTIAEHDSLLRCQPNAGPPAKQEEPSDLDLLAMWGEAVHANGQGIAATLTFARAVIAKTCKHTPGPWTVGTPGPNGCPTVGTARGLMVAMVAHSLEMPNQRGQAAGDAALISAAPDLLEALRGVLRVADRKTDEFDVARAAIAKATGEQA